MCDADRRQIEHRTEVQGEPGAPGMVTAGGVHEQYVGRLRQRPHRLLQQRSFAQREQPGLVRRAGPSLDRRHLLAVGGGCPAAIARVPRAVLSARKAHEAAADAAGRRGRPGVERLGGEAHLLVDKLRRGARPGRHLGIVPAIVLAAADVVLDHAHGRTMRDEECIDLLQWALPRLGLRWVGFRKVRRQVCRRIARRLDALGLTGCGAYRDYLERHPAEWAELDRCCRVTISRFWRDRGVFEALRDLVLPELGPSVRAWSVGCASGEEPYSLVLAANEAGVAVDVLATDIDDAVLERARAARYPESSLRELPDGLRGRAFDAGRLDPGLREHVTFRLHDVRGGPPDGPFDLVLCRNLVFTYFAEAVEHEVAHAVWDVLRPGGVLVVGAHEKPPAGVFEPWLPVRGIWRRGEHA